MKAQAKDAVGGKRATGAKVAVALATGLWPVGHKGKSSTGQGPEVRINKKTKMQKWDFRFV
jgi:hypothetical protein